MTNTARIEKAYNQYQEDGFEGFTKAIQDNLPPLCRIHTTSCVDSMLKSYDDGYKKGLAEANQQISVEAVKELREKREEKDNEYADTSIMQFVMDLDILLSQQQQDGDR